MTEGEVQSLWQPKKQQMERGIALRLQTVVRGAKCFFFFFFRNMMPGIMLSIIQGHNI